MLVLGIDPGVKGGLTLLEFWSGKVVATVGFQPSWTHTEFIAVLRQALTRDDLNDYVALEKVGFIRGDGGKGAFTFGRVDGLIRGAILFSGRRIREVSPVEWQGAMRCLTGGDKNVTKRRAQAIWPEIEWTHNTADSALIAEYFRRRLSNGTKKQSLLDSL